MTRKVMVHVALLAVFLVAALLTWTREPDSSSDDVPLLSLRGELDKVTYREPDREVLIERRKDDQGTYQWVTVEKWETPPAPPPEPKKPEPEKKPDEAKKDVGEGDKKPDDAQKDVGEGLVPSQEDAAKPDEPKAAEPEKKPEPKKIRKVLSFKGSQSAEALMKSLAKLSALRALGDAGKEKLEGFGLTRGDKSLTLESRGSKKELTLGENTYGNMDRYVLDRADQRVYVVAPRYLGDFPYAEFRLKDSGLSRVLRTEMTRVEVAAGGKQKTLLQRRNNTPQKAFWASPEAPDKAKVLYANWVDKLNRLSVVDYVARADEPPGLAEVLAVRYMGRGDVLDEIKLYRAPTPAVPAADKDKPRVVTPKDAYARSLHTRALVKINGSLLDEIERDLKSVME